MNIKRFLGIALAVIMVLTMIPAAALAKGVIESETENAKLRLLDSVWEDLESVEAQVLASGAGRTETVMAVYNAALNNELVDECSFTGVSAKSFFFTVDGMACCYDYVARQGRNFEAAADVKPIEVIPGTTKNGPVNMNVLLVGPYYGHDSSFTNQYRLEAQSIADATGGTVTILQSTGATGPAIAAACPNNGIVIFDSHGTQSGSSSYLCLTTNAGITSQDYSNGWAVNAGSEAYIDGRYIENHITSPLPNSIFWMAICEGMHVNGHGTTGYALLRAGAGVVYGYSQSVTFVGDYAIESIFWNKMKYEDYTVAEAFEYMVNTGCSANGSEPHGNAFPIVMSPDDPFPANPDSAQTVYSDWMLFGGNPVDAEGLSFPQESYGLAPTFKLKLEPVVNPADANNYSKTWTSSNPNVAAVDGRGTVTGVSAGTATITYTIASTAYSNSEYSFSASVEVVVSNEYLPEEVMYVPTNVVIPGETYVIGYDMGTSHYVMLNEYYSSGKTLKIGKVDLGEVAGVTCITSEVDPGSEWTWNADESIYNAETGKYLSIDGNYLVLNDSPIAWHYAATEGAATGTITQDVNSNSYLGGNSTNKFFNIFKTVHELVLYRKLVRGEDNPQPTPVPTQEPTPEPTLEPTPVPTLEPTPEPTPEPPPAPTPEPTPEPTLEPTPEPTLEPTPEPTEEPVMGDVSGDGVIDSEDALLILRAAMGLVELTPEQEALADFNGDGTVNSEDALLVMRLAMGL